MTTAAERQKKEWNVLVSHAQAVLSAFEEGTYIRVRVYVHTCLRVCT